MDIHISDLEICVIHVLESELKQYFTFINQFHKIKKIRFLLFNLPSPTPTLSCSQEALSPLLLPLFSTFFFLQPHINSSHPLYFFFGTNQWPQLLEKFSIFRFEKYVSLLLNDFNEEM